MGALGALTVLAAAALAHEARPTGTENVGRAPSTPAALTGQPTSAALAAWGALAAREPAYRMLAARTGVRASNPQQRLELTFARSSVRIASGALTLGLQLVASGSGAALRQVPAAAHARVRANTLTYAHPGIDEWFVNSPLGLEQGYTVARPGTGASAGTLTLALALSGNARARVQPGGREVMFTTTGGSSLSYGGLLARDARGRALRASFRLHGARLEMQVDAHGARYPLRIDPLVQQGPKLLATDEVGKAGFGFSLALSADGSTALIGGPNDADGSGAAWVFTRAGSAWTQQGAKLTGREAGGAAEDGGCAEEAGEAAGCGFGRSVALSADGNLALIGAPREDEHRGAAWVFARTGGTWTQVAKLTGGEEEGGHGRFGRAVALSADGSSALIGAPADGGHGAAFVFTRSGSAWTQQGSKLTGAAATGETHFGGAVALSADGSTALVGGSGDSGYQGAAWVFTRSGSQWAPLGPKLAGAEEGGEGRFGFSVALSADGTSALIGGRSDSGGAGAAWAFARAAESFSQQGPKLAPASLQDGEAEFGYSVALSGTGELAVVGGPADNGREGSAWVLSRNGGVFSPQPEKLAGSENTMRGWFGSSVSVSSGAGVVLVGGLRDNLKAGAAWAFEENPASLEQPTVRNVSPDGGPAAGGTQVTIKGSNFTGATAVLFGSSSAASFTVESATTIRAVSPAHPPGLVDVTVQAPAGTSAPVPADRFRFEGAATAADDPPEDPPTTTGSGGGAGSAGVLGASASNCRLSLLGRNLAVRSQRWATLRLQWRGAGTCRGFVRMTVTWRVGPKRFKSKAIGGRSFAITPGRVRAIGVRLNAAGRALLRSHHGRLSVRLVVVKLSPGPVQARGATVRLSSLQARRTAPKH